MKNRLINQKYKKKGKKNLYTVTLNEKNYIQWFHDTQIAMTLKNSFGSTFTSFTFRKCLILHKKKTYHIIQVLCL